MSERLGDGVKKGLGTEQVGEVCDSCDWELTIADVIERLRENGSKNPSARRIRSKFTSRGEGHAYFNRGHRVECTLTVDEIQAVLETDASV